jgi:hypothetical protein
MIESTIGKFLSGRWRRRWVLMGAGLALGVATGAAVRLTTPRHWMSAWPWEDQTAMVLGLSLLAWGLGLLVASLFRHSAAFVADPYGATGAGGLRRGEALYQRLTGATIALAGAMVLAPLSARWAPGLGSAVRIATMAGLVGGLGLQSVINLMIWRRSDELFRRLIVESTALTFWGLQGALFLWSAGERLRLLPAITAWQAFVVLLAGYLIASMVVSIRRGFS